MIINYFTVIFLIAISIFIITMLWLNFRQSKAVTKSFKKVPKYFEEKISLSDHQKAAKYTGAKLIVNHFEIIFSSFVLLLWTIGGGLNALDDFIASKLSSEILIGTAFILSIMLIGTLIDLPFSLYKTFIVEQKFDFNKMDAKTFISDLSKEVILTVIISAPIIMLILYLMGNMGGYWWLFAWIALLLITLVMYWIYPIFIAPIFNKFTPLKDKELKTSIEDLLKKSGFKSNGIFVMDGSKRSSHSNAYFTGIGKNKRIVFFDTILKNMSNDEILAILAHELGHFYHKHIIKRMLNSSIISLILLAILGFLINKTWFYHGLGVLNPSNYTALVLFMITAPVFSFFISPIFNHISRKHEFQADTFAAKQTKAEYLISALVKLYKENAATLTPDSIYSMYHDSHPNASIRINNLKNNNE